MTSAIMAALRTTLCRLPSVHAFASGPLMRAAAAAGQPHAAWGTQVRHASLHGVTSGSEELPLHTGRKRVVVIGTGWGAARLLRDLDPSLYDMTVISMRNHMVFTPLLASTTVGTLDPHSVTVHITDIQRALFQPQNKVFIAEATTVDTEKRVVQAHSADGIPFQVKYQDGDKLVIATGSQGSTFGIPGVLQHTHFLRDVHQAQAIRSKLIDNIALAGVPGRDLQEWHRLLHIVIVGGGPTGVEVAGELLDFIAQDLRKLYPERARAMRVTLIEAREVLGSFDTSLREYAARKLIKRGAHLHKGVVKTVSATELTLTDGTVIPFGLCIWSTGVGPTPFTQALQVAKTPVGRIAIDGRLRVLAVKPAAPAPSGDKVGKAAPASLLTDESSTGPAPHSLELVPDMYALGDACANAEKPLPALAQVAEQQGRYLAWVLNYEAQQAAAAASGKQSSKYSQPPDAFVYRSLGSMATVGDYSGVLELHADRGRGKLSPLSIAGWLSWLAWRSAYLTRLGSMQKRLRVAFNWTLTFIFGRDMSTW